MSTPVIQRTSAGWGRPDVGGAAWGPGMERVVGPRGCVIDPCAYARTGLVSLVSERCNGTVLSLESSLAYQQLPQSERIQSGGVVAFRLPTALAPLLDAVTFLHRFLSQPVHGPSPGRWSVGRVVLLTDLSPFWLYDTLRSALPEVALLSVSVLPARARPQQVRAALLCAEPRTQLVHQALKTTAVRRARGLSANEINVLRHLLVDDVSIAVQARIKGVSAKTLYSQRLSAMRKLGVRTLSGLLRWSVRPRGGRV